MSMSLSLSGIEKSSIPTGSRFPSATLPQLSPRFPPMDARLVAAARLPPLSMYGSPYNSPNFPAYLPYAPSAAAVAAAAATDPSVFYSPLGPGENADGWRASLSQAAAYYDPTMAHYGYGYGAMGLSDGARRKNATRETTSTLKAWLNEHRKNPYPTKGEKIMLAIITKMTLTQVSTWFANARRRLKKENKMTWSPRNRVGEDDDDDDVMDDGPLNDNQSRLSSDSPDVPPNSHVANHSLEKSYNGHSSGIESNSEEMFSFTKKENVRPLIRNPNIEKNETETISHSDPNQNSLEESRQRLSSSLLSRPHSLQYNPSLVSSPQSNPAISSTISRPNPSFPPGLPQMSVVPPHPNMIHPGLQEQLNHPSLNRLPPHIMAALIEQQLQYHQALQGLPMNNLLNTSAEATKTSPSITTSESEQSSVASGRASSISPATSKPSSALPSPNKSKIWSIADVAMSGDSNKNYSKSNENLDHLSGKPAANEISQATWMDILQQKIAATMSGSADPQQFSHLPMNSNLNSPLIPHGRFPSFPNFSAGLLGMPDNAQSALHTMDGKIQGSPERISNSPQNHFSDGKDESNSEKNPTNNLSPDKNQGERSPEANET